MSVVEWWHDVINLKLHEFFFEALYEAAEAETFFSPNTLTFLQVSTADQRRSSPKTMISCNKKSLYLPSEMPAIHVEFTEYYFPDGKDYPSETLTLLVPSLPKFLVFIKFLDKCNIFPTITPSSFCSCSSLSQPVRPAKRPAARSGSSQPGVDQPLRSWHQAESGAVHGDLQAQRLSEARRARWHQGGRSHAKSKGDCGQNWVKTNSKVIKTRIMWKYCYFFPLNAAWPYMV